MNYWIALIVVAIMYFGLLIWACIWMEPYYLEETSTYPYDWKKEDDF